MTTTSGRVDWATGPTDRELGPFIAAKTAAVARGLAAAQRARDEAAADAFCAALLAASED